MKKFSRRSACNRARAGFPAGVCIVAVCLVFNACSKAKTANSGAAEDTLYLYNWTYYLPESVLDKFREEYKVKVVYDEYASNEEMYAKIQAGGGGYDIVFPTSDFIEIMTQQGMLAKIDHNKLNNVGNLEPRIVALAAWDPDMEYFIPYYYGAATISVNTARIPEFDDSWKSWDIFERAAYKGKMTMLDDMRMVIGGALMKLGYSSNSANKAEIYAASSLINNKWKPNIMRFDSEAFGKGYASEDFWIVHGYFEGIKEEMGGNTALASKTAVFIPREGAPAYLDGMCILKDAKHKELAHKFIDFFLRPEIFAEFADYFNFPATVNVPARALLKNKPFLPVEEFLDKTMLNYDIGEAIQYYNSSWFETIRIGE
ncbi:MAG: extracellular solute-binding protein [Spirochaetaceae bacterium]|jgi:spermidine/putrescine transport system substrate-binding protein|nr:extracellular solute-binding protein [Spirochaetaceae bacterium]